MKKFFTLALLTVFGIVNAAPIDVYFSPNGGATAALVREIDAAKTDIRVMTYQLTSKPIAEALIAAKARGVTLNVIVDKSQSKSTIDQYCCAAKVAAATHALMDRKHPIQHNKVILIDGKTVITGSFNFSNAAEKANAENVLVIRDPALAQKYLADWDKHASHSESF
jgi:phosphatidylserine/phosphatidylglycerophosphate/cardiolipin synthase-like enzyme